MASILGLDPSGLAEAAGVLGQMSAPSRLPVGLGSILGAAGGAYQKGKRKAAMDEETLEMQRELRKAQTEQLNEQIRQRQEAVAAQQDKARKLAKFNSILQTSENPADPVSILGAGVQSGAFGPQEITSFMGNVMQKQAKIEADVEKERIRLQDRTIAREEREAAERRMVELRNQLQQDNIRLQAALKPPAQEPLVPVEENGQVVYTPRSQATGKIVPPPRRDARGLPPTAIKELGATGETATAFLRLAGTFKDDFGGKKVGILGEAQNLVGRNVGGGFGDQADWWQDYQMQKNIVRNKLFGSALTATERAEFDKAVITPGMTPALIRKNLSRQKAAAVRAAKKLSGAYRAGGYSDEQINEALGLSPMDLAEDSEKDPWE